MSSAPILVADSDAHKRRVTVAALREAGHRITEAEDGEEVLALLDQAAPEVVVLDVGLGPDGPSGFEVCRRIRSTSDVPVIFLAVQEDEVDELLSLAVGGDEYLAKPVSPRRLNAHVDAILRRRGARARQPQPVDQFPIHVDPAARVASVNGRLLALTCVQFDLLAALAEHPTHVVTRRQLVEQAWGPWFGTDHHLDVHISRLRAKIVEAGGPRVPSAVRGIGFCLVERS